MVGWIFGRFVGVAAVDVDKKFACRVGASVRLRVYHFISL